jgi:hypothetical protein
MCKYFCFKNVITQKLKYWNDKKTVKKKKDIYYTMYQNYPT